MFCPECGAEFKEGIKTCDECDVALVVDPPPEPELENYVSVLETSDLPALPVIKSALRAAGIPTRIEGEGLIDLFPTTVRGAPMHSSAGEVIIRVPEEYADEARRLLEEAAMVKDPADDGTEGDTGGAEV